MAIMWMRLSQIRDFYLMGLNRKDEYEFLFGAEAAKLYEPEKPTLTGFIKFFRDFNISTHDLTILNDKNEVIKQINNIKK